MKKKIPGVNLNKAPTIKDFILAARIVDVVMDHYKELKSGRPKEVLSDKIAARIKQFRITRK
jgi:hypothetical protein